MNPQKVTVPEILKRKHGPKKIAMLTAYDYPFARILDEAGIDVLLVGDTLGMVVQGLDTTLPVSVDEIIYHLKMVTRARTRALVVGDLPFLSYQVSTEEAMRNAGRMMKEGGAEAVKLEGGVHVAETIAALSSVDIPVMRFVLKPRRARLTSFPFRSPMPPRWARQAAFTPSSWQAEKARASGQRAARGARSSCCRSSVTTRWCRRRWRG